MKSYLITGGAGFIGSHISDALLARGDRVVVLDNFVSGNRANLPVRHANLTLIEGDIRDIDRHAARIGRVDVVIHLAALISGYDSLNSPDEYIDVNVTGLQRVIDFAGEQRVTRIAFSSSSTVYGNAALAAIDEAVVPAPLTVYAASKLMGEHLLSMYSTLRGYSYCSLRLFNVYGPRQAVDHPYANVTCKFSHAAANGLPVRKYGDGNQTRDFIYIDDVVRAFLCVIDTSENKTYNIGTGRSRSINDLIAALEKIIERPLGVEALDPWPNDIRHIRADIRRFTEDFQPKPLVDLEDGLARTVASFRA